MRMHEEQEEEEDEAKKQVVVPVPYRETATRRSHRVTPTNFISGDLTGKPQISGERLLPNGDFYTGSLSGQIPDGTGKYLWSDGCMYEGEWKNGKTAGKGKFSWPSGATYEGEFKSSFMDGFGIFTGSNGDTYRGFWSMNHKQGFGHKWYSNGDCYEGTWFRNLQEGQGRYVWKNGNEYVGEWKNGAIWGRGVLISVNGDRFDGQWENGIPKGNGVFTWSDGSFYVGTWNHDPNQNSGVFYPPPSSSIDDDCSMVDRDSKVSAINWSRKRSSVDGGGSLVERNLSSNFPRICIWESDGEAGDITCDIVDNALMFYRDGYCQEKNLIKRRAPCCFHGEDKKKPGQTISKGHKNYDLMLNLQLGIRYSVGKTAPYRMRDLRPADFDPREKYWTRFPVEGSKVTPPHQSVEFRWKDYCPMVFRHLRGLFEIDAADYMLSICGNDALRELSSPGKSGSFFYLTQDDRFMIKTVKKSEVKVLLRMLPSYYYHVSRYENSLVTRFFGVHCVKPIGGQKVRFIVMGNLFCSEYRIHRRFDLKGSSHGRSTDKPEGEIDETTTLKDLDLNFVFRLPGTWFQELIKQIDRDCEFLEAERIMDYSLLVGLHFRDPSAAKLGQSPFVLPRKDELDPDERDESQGRCSEEEHDKILVGRKPLIRLGANMPARAEHVARTSGSEQNQSESSEGEINEVILYFGIIDILQDYDISKKLEHAYKSFQADPTSISAVDPKLYSKRFRDFIGRIFVED